MICKNLGFIVKNAFTLAEVLITLIIIGVISALAVPNLVVKYHKKMTAMQVQKAYSELNQVLNRAIAAHGEPSNWDYYGESELSDWVKKYIVPYVKGAEHKACTTNEKCFGLPLYFPLHFDRPGSVNTTIGQYVVSKPGNPIAYGFFRYGGVYEPVTRVRVYIKK